MHPTYYVRHPDDTYSVVDPQPAEVLVDAAITTLNQLGRMVGNSERENNRIRAALTAAFSEADARATPADAGAGLTDEPKIADMPLWHYNEQSKEMHPDPCGEWVRASTAEHAILTSILADRRAHQSPAPVTAEPAQSIDTPEFRELLDKYRHCASWETEGVIDELCAHIATPAPADRDAIRDQALEEAAKAVDAVSFGHHAAMWAQGLCAKAVRALKSMERAADAAETRDAKGGEQ